MSERESDPEPTGPNARGMPAGLVAVLVIALLALLGIGARYHVHGDVNFIHCLFSLFFSTNLLVCYWEMCLFFRWDYIAARSDHWQRRRRETVRLPAAEFLSTRVPLTRILSPAVWADTWATYSTIDPSYPDREKFAFNAEVGNGFVTPVPTLVLYAAYTIGFVPAVVAGILGIMLFWQWVYLTSMYWVVFFAAGRHASITRRELYTCFAAPNSVWVLIPLLGLYVSVRLILDGDFSVLGY